MRQNRFLSLITLTFACFLLSTGSVVAQVSTFTGKTRGNSHRLVKDVPIRTNSEVRGDGKPTMLYVVQLARFEDMDYIPSTFPKGTFLWNSHDHINEKILFAGYYDSLDAARSAATTWKRQKMFSGAFARPMPFIVRYD